MPLSKHFRFCLWWESFFNGGHFSTCQTRKKSTPVTFFLHMRHVFLRPGVISLRRKMTPRSIFDGGRYLSLHRPYSDVAKYIFKVSGATARWPFTDSAVPSSLLLLLRSAGLQPADLLLILLFLPHYYSYSYSSYYYYYYYSNINFLKRL